MVILLIGLVNLVMINVKLALVKKQIIVYLVTIRHSLLISQMNVLLILQIVLLVLVNNIKFVKL